MVADLTKLLFTSNKQIDKVLKVDSGSFSVAAPTGGLGDITREAEDSFDTEIDETTFFYGIYSIDNGETWNDFNVNVVTFVGGNPVFQTCDVWGESTNNTFTIRAQNWYNFAAGSGTARTILWKVAIIAKSTQGFVPKGNTNERLQFTSSYNYQKIAVDEITPVTIGSGVRASYDVVHDLFYIPQMRGFVEELGIMYDIGNRFTGDAFSAIEIDETKVRYTIDNTGNPNSRTIDLHTRIYHND